MKIFISADMEGATGIVKTVQTDHREHDGHTLRVTGSGMAVMMRWAVSLIALAAA